MKRENNQDRSQESDLMDQREIDTDSSIARGEVADAPDAGNDADFEAPDPLAVALAELAQLADRYVRLQAEWDNYRKRTEVERSLERRRASAQLVERLLPVVDDLERAEQHLDGASTDVMLDGIRAVTTKFIDVLSYEGLEAIDPLGEAFDINLHQAIARIEDASVFDETVMQVYQKGYTLAGRVLRTAMVVVSSGGPHREPEPETDDSVCDDVAAYDSQNDGSSDPFDEI